MSIEIERKFLVTSEAWRGEAVACERLRQGYLANTEACSIRVRAAGGRGYLSVKGMEAGPSRREFEYAIAPADAEAMLAAFAGRPLIEKLRHRVPAGGRQFEVDEFEGENTGLVVAEIELGSPDESFPRPDWLGDEVTDDARFYNFRLVSDPFSRWGAAVKRAVQAGRRPSGGRP